MLCACGGYPVDLVRSALKTAQSAPFFIFDSSAKRAVCAFTAPSAGRNTI